MNRVTPICISPSTTVKNHKMWLTTRFNKILKTLFKFDQQIVCKDNIEFTAGQAFSTFYVDAGRRGTVNDMVLGRQWTSYFSKLSHLRVTWFFYENTFGIKRIRYRFWIEFYIWRKLRIRNRTEFGTVIPKILSCL